jgi:hypothetical protein
VKKAQASGASALVAVMLILVVLYILFVPPDLREEILGENWTETGTHNGDNTEFNASRVIVYEHPGRIEEISKLEIKQSLPSVYLTSVYENKLIDQENSVYVKSAWFGEQAAKVEFPFPAPNLTKNTILSFNVNKYGGRLLIYLNQKLIYNNEITQPSPAPITIPGKYLQEGNNEFEFRVSGVGLAFWSANEYSLAQVKLTADVKDTSKQVAETSFLVTTSELINMEKMTMTYYPDCSPGKVNPLEISLNDRLLVSSIPDCGALHKKEFLPERLVTGENAIVFRSTSGSYLMRDIAVISKLKAPTYPAYYFELSKDQMKEIKRTGLNMSMKFLSTEFKNLEISVNGGKVFIDTDKKSYFEDISDLVREGTNAIKITPLSPGIDILDFKVMIDEK